VKTFSFGGNRVETRLLVRHEDGDWGGYSYEWDEAQKDAALLPSGKSKALGETAGGRAWSFPSRSDCMRCHTTAAGRTLGLELGQLDGDFVYASTHRLANQITTLEHIGVLQAGKKPEEITEYPAPFGDGSLDARARAYLHANCAGCHRPAGGAARAEIDLRFGVSLAETKTCGRAPLLDDLGIPEAKIVAPGSPETSILSRRIHATDATRMPPRGRHLVDEKAAVLIDDWIRETVACP
jgi:hypothetical protein